MKFLRLLLVTSIAFNLLACSETKDPGINGRDVTDQFLSRYSGTFEEQTDTVSQPGERLTITRDGEVEVLKHRNVGETNNPVMPNPTVCSFLLRGQVAYVSELFDDFRTRTNEEGETYLIPQTHNLVFNVYQVELTDELHAGSTTSTGCLAFQEKMNQFLPVYTYGMELFERSTLRLHTSGGGDYDGGDRTDSTLDEVFVRSL